MTSTPLSGLHHKERWLTFAGSGRYVPDFIHPAEETALLGNADAESWIHDLKRRVQHYGYRYDTTRRN